MLQEGGNNQVRIVDTTQQYDGSNDCGVFTLLTPTAALKRGYSGAGEELAERVRMTAVGGSAEESLGMNGRRFILDSIMKHSIDIENMPNI
jgi:hypothetical protein